MHSALVRTAHLPPARAREAARLLVGSLLGDDLVPRGYVCPAERRASRSRTLCRLRRQRRGAACSTQDYLQTMSARSRLARLLAVRHESKAQEARCHAVMERGATPEQKKGAG